MAKTPEQAVAAAGARSRPGHCPLRRVVTGLELLCLCLAAGIWLTWTGWIAGWLAGCLALGGMILGSVAVNAAAIARSTFPYKSAASKAELAILITLAVLSWPLLLFCSLVLFLGLLMPEMPG